MADALASRPRTASSHERQALWFTGAILTACLALQRFAVPLSGRSLSVVGPIGLALMIVCLARGSLSFHRTRLVTFLMLTVFVLAGAAWQAAVPGSLGTRDASSNSLLLFLGLTSFATVTFTKPVDETTFFRLVTFAFMLVALAGIAQFFAQFAGLRVFAFKGFFPLGMLNEATYHLVIPVGVAGLLKSNGFFLIEPSVFSQIMAIGLIIEAVGTRRPLYIGLFTLGLLLSFSGTGWLVLGSFLVGSSIGMGWRGLAAAAGVVVLMGVALGAAALLAPDALASLTNRLGEINQPGTSGHLRFITPFWMLDDVIANRPSAMLVGIGSGRSEMLSLPYDYAVNTAIKVVAEYGVPALVAYVLLFVLGRKTRIQTAIVLPSMVLFMFTGGYHEFSPLLFLVLLLTAVARLRPGAPAPAVMPARLLAAQC